MNYPGKKRTHVAVLAGLTILSACTKQIEQENAWQENIIQTYRVTGALDDNPELEAKVPVIVSKDLLQSIGKGSISVVQLAKRPSGGKTDGTAPTLSIISPSAGATVSGTINIQVSASDNVGVALVSLQVDGVSAGSSTVSPFTISWNSASVPDGLHTLTLTAKDAAGNATSKSVQVTVKTPVAADITNPTVSITSPGNGASVSGTVSISANASDNVSVSNVSFSIDGSVLATDNSSPYTTTWNSDNVAAGLHTITATATDASGNKSSQAIQVTVNTTVIEPTPLPANVLLAMPPVLNQGIEGSCVAFAVGYAARSSEQYYRTNSTSFSQSTNIFSPEYLFNLTATTDCSGSAILNALNTLVNKGICTWASMPYTSSNGCALQPTASQNNEALNFRIASYKTVYTSDITAMKTMISQKHPLAIVISNDKNFNNAGPGYIWKSFDLSAGTGQHAITICGYDDARHAYKAINSWGTTWGDAGYIWIDYDFLPQVKSTCYVMN